MRLLPAIAVTLLLASVAAASDNADVEIYTDYMIGQWVDSSTATVNYSATDRLHSYNTSAKVTMSAGSYVRIHHSWGGLSATGQQYFDFWIYPTSSNARTLTFQATVLGNLGPVVPILNYSPVNLNQWNQVRVPLVALRCLNQYVQDIYIRTTVSQPSYWLEDIKLTHDPLVGTSAIRIDTRPNLYTFNSRMFGVSTFPWDWTIPSNGTRDRMVEGGFTILSFPGGNVADEYDWVNNRNRRNGLGPAGYGTDGFLQLANNIGADKIISVNYGSGTVQEAAAWVNYCNIIRNSNVLYWNVGNEVYHHDEYDLHQYPHDAYTYAGFVRDSHVQMKAVDPRIKIGVEGGYDQYSSPQRISVINPRTGENVNGWAAVLLATLHSYNVTPDFFNIHFYPTGPGLENDSYLLQSSSVLQIVLGNVRQMLRDYYGSAGDNIPVYITENNSTWMPCGKQSTSIVNALYLAKIWATSSLNNVQTFVWWNFHNGLQDPGNNHPSLYGWRDYGDFGVTANGLTGPESVNTPYPTFYAFKLLKAFARPGDRMVACTTASDLLVSYACKATNGKVRLLVINMSKASTLSASTSFLGFWPRATATLTRYGMEQDIARQSEYTAQVPLTGPVFNTNYPPYSITVVEFTPNASEIATN